MGFTRIICCLREFLCVIIGSESDSRYLGFFKLSPLPGGFKGVQGFLWCSSVYFQGMNVRPGVPGCSRKQVQDSSFAMPAMHSHAII